jgi:two-component system, OmpR family, sensor histidine kinase KdpD
MTASTWRRDLRSAAVAAGVLAVATAVLQSWLRLGNPTSAAMIYLLVVLVTATVSTLRVAITTSVLADACLNFYFMPPLGTLTIADPQNWVALLAFLAVSVVASDLSSIARARAREATARRDELARLFDLSRDVLQTTDGAEAVAQLAVFVARRFALDFSAICLPDAGHWRVFRAGALDVQLGEAQLSRVYARSESSLEFDARARTYAGHETVTIAGQTLRVVPLRVGTRAVGLLVAAGRTVEPGTLDALAGVAAIAVERAQLLEDRKRAELAQQGEELKSALLASLSHDLRTPLTAIRVAASNLQAAWPTEAERREQSDLVLAEVARLTRLFDNIVEMARIDAGALPADARWVHPAEIFEAARDQVEHSLRRHGVQLVSAPDALVRVDPRLTASALAHLLENAAQYSPPGSSIDVRMSISPEGFLVAVHDRGPGIAAADLPHLFDRFYRGSASRQRVSGTGMGLSIARGLLAAQGGRIWGDNCADGGAEFTMLVQAESRPEAVVEQIS